MKRMEPTPFNLFCAYYLGMNERLESEFFNMNKLAERVGMPVDDLIRLMEKYHLDAPTMRHIPFNYSKAHGDIQDLLIEGKHQEALKLARRFFKEFLAALREIDESKDFETVDYEHILGDLDKPPKGNLKEV